MAWARLDDGFGDHPKVLDLIDTLPELEGAAAIGLWTLALAYAHRTMRTAKEPGFIPRSFARSRARVPAYIGDRLVGVGLWEEREGGWLIHDYADYLPSDELKAKRAEAGKRGAEARWGKTAGSDSNLPSASHDDDGKKCPEPETEPEPDKNTSITSATAAPPTDPPPDSRNDVTRICTHLANRIEANGSKRPTVTNRWRTTARLMLDADKRTENDIHAAIDWCQDSDFWRSNVMSLPKLREKYDAMRLQAERASQAPAGQLSTGQQRLAQAAAIAERMRLLDEAEAAGQNTPNLFALPSGRTV